MLVHYKKPLPRFWESFPAMCTPGWRALSAVDSKKTRIQTSPSVLLMFDVRRTLHNDVLFVRFLLSDLFFSVLNFRWPQSLHLQLVAMLRFVITRVRSYSIQ